MPWWAWLLVLAPVWWFGCGLVFVLLARYALWWNRLLWRQNTLEKDPVLLLSIFFSGPRALFVAVRHIIYSRWLLR